MSRYEEKKKARIARYEKYSDNAQVRSDQAYQRNRAIGSHIPMGQPILVGHHSERRARADQKRMHNAMDKSLEEQKKAEYWARRAKAAESNRAIDSSDPEAITKIKEKIAKLKEANELTKVFNARMRKYKTWSVLEQLGSEHPDFELKVHVDKRRSYYAIPPDNLRAFYLNTTRNTAEVKRLEKRIAQIENASKLEGFTIKGHEVLIDDGQLQVHCAFKPDETGRKILKSYPISLKWSRYSMAWVRKLGPSVTPYWMGLLKQALTELKEEQ